MIAEHLGKLHPLEHVLVFLLAFGPLLLLAVTIRIARKRVEDEPAEDEGSEEERTGDV